MPARRQYPERPARQPPLRASFTTQDSGGGRSTRPRPEQSSRRPRNAPPRPVPAPAASRRGRDSAQRAGRYVLQYAGARYLERQERSSQSRARNQQVHGESALGHAVSSVLLEQLLQEIIEFLVRHDFFLPRRRGTSDSGPDRSEPDQQPASQDSQTSFEQRRRRRHRRRNQAMMHSLDRLSSELQTTHDAAVNLLRHDTEPPAQLEETLRSSADDLRRATTRCMARVEAVRHQHGSRRPSRHTRPEPIARRSASRSASFSAGPAA